MRKGELLEKAGEVYEELEVEILHLEEVLRDGKISKALSNRVAGLIQRIKDGRQDLSEVVMRCLGKRTPVEVRELLEGMIKKAEFFQESSRILRGTAEKEAQGK